MNLFKGKRANHINIPPQEARRMMEGTESFTLLDVRTPQEYKQARIEGAKLIPVDELGSRAASEMPDKNKLVLVYCQSGMRADRAAKMLKQMGYVNVYNFGGIVDWPYGTVKG